MRSSMVKPVSPDVRMREEQDKKSWSRQERGLIKDGGGGGGAGNASYSEKYSRRTRRSTRAVVPILRLHGKDPSSRPARRRRKMTVRGRMKACARSPLRLLAKMRDLYVRLMTRLGSSRFVRGWGSYNTNYYTPNHLHYPATPKLHHDTAHFIPAYKPVFTRHPQA